MNLENSERMSLIDDHPPINLDSPSSMLGLLVGERSRLWWSQGASEDDGVPDLLGSAARMLTDPVSGQVGLEMRKSRVEEVLHWRRSESGLLRIFVDHLKLIPSFWSLAEQNDEMFLHLSTHLG